MDWGALGDALATSIKNDLAGWVAVALVLIGALVAFVRRRRIGAWLRDRFAARAERAKFRARESTVTILFAELLSPPGHHITQYGERLGGTIRYSLANLGPSVLEYPRIELVSAEISPLTVLNWARVEKDAIVSFTIDIPFNVGHDVLVAWEQGRHRFSVAKTLPLSGPGNAS